MLNIGDSIKGRLSFVDERGRRFDDAALSQYRAYAIYFYPMDFTRICTEQACSFRDVYGEITGLGGMIFGVSLDTDEKHKAFRDRYAIPFPLVYDRDKSLSRLFGTLRWGGLFRNKRVTFIIDAAGVIRHRVHDENSAAIHTETVIRFLKSLP